MIPMNHLIYKTGLENSLFMSEQLSKPQRHQFKPRMKEMQQNLIFENQEPSNYDLFACKMIF